MIEKELEKLLEDSNQLKMDCQIFMMTTLIS